MHKPKRALDLNVGKGTWKDNAPQYSGGNYVHTAP